MALGDVPPAEDVDVLALPAAAAPWLQRALGPSEGPTIEAVGKLAASFGPGGSLALQYEALAAFTAAETFERRRGNCLSHAHLFIALARSLGMDARYREVLRPPQPTRQDAVMIWSRHVGAFIDLRRQGTLHVDFGGPARAGAGWGRRISDVQARAQHFNNRGAAALLSGEVAASVASFRRALHLDRSRAFIWSNLGLAYQRAGRFELAEWSLREAVRLDRHHFPALDALEGFYRRAGALALADAFADRAERARRDHPFARYDRGLAALAQGDAASAVRHLEAAAEGLPDQTTVFLALAKAYFAARRFGATKSALKTAAELATTREDRMRVAQTIDELQGERRRRLVPREEAR